MKFNEELTLQGKKHFPPDLFTPPTFHFKLIALISLNPKMLRGVMIRTKTKIFKGKTERSYLFKRLKYESALF